MRDPFRPGDRSAAARARSVGPLLRAVKRRRRLWEGVVQSRRVSKPRLLFLNTRMVVGGPAKVTVALAEELAARGYDAALASGAPESDEVSDPRTDRSALQRFDIPGLHRRLGPWSDLAATLQIRSLLASQRPDVLLTAGAKAGMLGRVAARLVRPRPRTIHIFHGHVFKGHFGKLPSRGFALVERALSTITDDLIAICPSVAEDLKRFGIDRHSRLHTIYIGAELTPFLEQARGTGELRRELGIDRSTYLAVYPARICKVKAQDVIIEALGIAREALAKRDFRLVFVGDGETREALVDRARALGVSDHVVFLGYRADMERIYADADLVVLASRHEGTPVALMEASAAGLPFLATSVGGVRDLWRDGLGRLVPPEDPEALAEALRWFVAAGPPARLSETLRREVVARFSVRRFADEMEKVLERATRGQ
jgi:glycosyltransferase involved in cell wall biosynthesis